MKEKDIIKLRNSDDAFRDRLDATISEMTAGRPSATEVVSARKTEVLDFLRAGISWRRLAYLLQLPESSVREAVKADPDLAHEKRPEGYGTELALAKQFAKLQQAGFPIADLERWVKARTAYDTARAKNAYYRREAGKAIANDRIDERIKIVKEVVGEPVMPGRVAFELNEMQWEEATKTIDDALIIDYDGNT